MRLTRYKKINKGFGLLEVLLAGVVVITIVGGLVFLGRTSMNNLTYLQQKSQATFLAQEGVEAVRQIRDTNYIDNNRSTKWNSLIGESLPQIGEDYYFDIGNTMRIIDNSSFEEVELSGVTYTRSVRFESPDNLLSNPTDVNPSESAAYIVSVVVDWDQAREPVEIRELVVDSRQRF